MLQAVNGILTRQPGSTLYHPMHGSRGAFSPTYRASVSSSDRAHLLVVIRAIHAAADSREPPDHKPAGEGDGGGCPSPPVRAASACSETWDEGDGVTIDSLRLNCGSLPFTGD